MGSSLWSEVVGLISANSLFFWSSWSESDLEWVVSDVELGSYQHSWSDFTPGDKVLFWGGSHGPKFLVSLISDIVYFFGSLWQGQTQIQPVSSLKQAVF